MNQAPEESKTTTTTGQENPPFWRVVLSVLQASFGVQSRDNRERDFNSRSILPYVVAAILFTVVFVLVLVTVVNLILPN